MSDVFISRRGGGMNLNFRVTRYPLGTDLSGVTGKTNEIAVLTDTPFPEWVFSFHEPTLPAADMIWIKLADTAYATFNALKKNGVVIAGAAAYQYLSGEWQSIHALIYQEGEWREFRKYLFRSGLGAIERWKGYSGSAAITSDSMAVSRTDSSNPGVVTFDTFDFSPYQYLCLDFTQHATSSNNYKFGITFTRTNTNKLTDIYSATQGATPSGAVQNKQYTVGVAPVLKNVRTTIKLAIADAVKSAPCYLGFAFYVGAPAFTVYNVWLE